MIELDQTTSTNDEARSLIQGGRAFDGLVIWAHEQTQGRGRRGRQWISPSGNLHCSILINVEGQQSQSAQLGFVAAVALVDALQALLPNHRFSCKWPNDVMGEGRKVAGMLLEFHTPQWLVLGLGVDVAHTPPPEMLERPAICLAEMGYQGDVRAVLDGFYEHFMPKIDEWRMMGFSPFRNAWLERAYGKDAPLVVRLDHQTLEGRFMDLDPEGALLMVDQNGQNHRIVAGDVFMGGAGAAGH